MLTMLLLLACNTNEAPATAAPTEAAPPVAVDSAATLAKADAHDGAVDKVVGECSVCALAMEGDPALAVQHEGYELHFCSERCQKGFAADPVAGVGRLSSFVE